MFVILLCKYSRKQKKSKKLEDLINNNTVKLFSDVAALGFTLRCVSSSHTRRLNFDGVNVA